MQSTRNLVRMMIVAVIIAATSHWSTWIGAQDSHRTAYAVNRSTKTMCAEEDNVNIPLVGMHVRSFKVTATTPKYETGEDKCQPDFSNCPPVLAKGPPRKHDQCAKLFDNGIDVLETCIVDGWWRERAMEVVTPTGSGRGHYVRLYHKTPEGDSYPQTFVLYQDGNARIKPLPPKGKLDVCFGSSVLIGSAPMTERPFADIERVVFTSAPPGIVLSVHYVGGNESRFTLVVDRGAAVLTVVMNELRDSQLPFATVRSMWVSDDNCDVAQVTSQEGTLPILNWKKANGPWWMFGRTSKSRHNTSAPDLRIELVP